MSIDTAIKAELATFAEAAKELQAALHRIPDRRTSRIIHSLIGLSLWFAGIVTGAAGVLAVHHTEIISTIKENRAAIESLRAAIETSRYDATAGVDAGTDSGGRGQ